MKIVIDAYQASPAITGSDRLARNMLRELQLIDSTNEFIVITNAIHGFIAEGVNAKNFLVLPIHAKKRLIWLNFQLPILLLRERADVFFSFHNFAGPGIKVCRTICSILDTIPFTEPDLYFGKSSILKRRVVRKSMRRCVRQADEFIAISSFTKSSTVRALQLSPDRIKVMLLQADPVFFAPANKVQLVAVADKYKLPSQFVFALGANDPRKNIARLIQAHRTLPEDLRIQYPLMIGGAKWHSEEITLDDDPHTRLLGFIADEDLPLVFRLATVFAFPSLFEGFGLTVLEAMASDTAVITSNTTSIPETAGDAAVLIEPESVTAIRNALEKLLTNPNYREQLVKAGKKQVKRFSWEKAASLLHGVLTRPN